MDRYFFHNVSYGYDVYKSCALFSQQRLDLVEPNDLYDRFMQKKFDFVEPDSDQ